MTHYIATLAERDYLFGAGVLYNSLARNGFSGVFVLGYRAHPENPDYILSILKSLSDKLVLVELDTPIHFTNYKPSFLKTVLSQFSNCTAASYIDPDIVVHCPSSWITSWCQGGPVACADVNWCMPALHPTRRTWIEIMQLKVHHQLDLYLNAGFLSIKREDIGFLSHWESIIHRAATKDSPIEVTGDISTWRSLGKWDGRWIPFMAIDQDALNIAMMTWGGPVVVLGPDIMGFTALGILPHAIGSNKPWRVNYLINALLGKPPRYVDKMFWKYVQAPISIFPSRRSSLANFVLRMATLISRFYRRNG